MAYKLPAFPVLHRHQVQALVQKAKMVFLEQAPGQGAQQVNDLTVGVDGGLPFIGALGHILADQAHHPGDAEDVVDVLVGDENGAQVPPVDVGLLQAAQEGIASAAVHQQVLLAAAEDKAGVIASGDHGIARAQHDKFHRSCPFCVIANIITRMGGWGNKKIATGGRIAIDDGRGRPPPLRIVSRKDLRPRNDGFCHNIKRCHAGGCGPRRGG